MPPNPSLPSQPWLDVFGGDTFAGASSQSPSEDEDLGASPSGTASAAGSSLPPPPPLPTLTIEPDSPPPANSGGTNGSLLSQQEVLAGWLYKRTGGDSRRARQRAASATSSGLTKGFFWRRRYFVLTGAQLSYFKTECDATGILETPTASSSLPPAYMTASSSGPSTGAGQSVSSTASPRKPRGSMQVVEVDDVVVNDREVLLHFATSQRTGRGGARERKTLCLCGNSAEETERWASAIRQETARRLRAMLPSGWDISTMLNGSAGSAKRVAKVTLDVGNDLVTVIQDLMDSTFICKKTRDRRGQEVPVGVEVAKVVCVQNVAAWMAYERARERVRERFRVSDAPPLTPEVLTATVNSSALPSAPSLGMLDEESNEQWLFHGTKVASADGITNSEFRMDLAGTHRGTLYGKAVYLAECASKADEYSEEDDVGLCRMLICRAALGSLLIEREKHPSAPELEEECRRRYDSLCGDRWAAVGTFREFVLYESSQVYPEYIVYYRRMYQGELLQAIGQLVPEECTTSARAQRIVPHAAKLAQGHPDPQARYRISLLLGAHSHTVVPVLAKCLKDQSPMRRRTAALALAHIADFTALSRGSSGSAALIEDIKEKGRDSPLLIAVPELVACLCDPCEAVRIASAQAFEQIGPISGKKAVPALASRLADASEDVRCAAAKALEKMGGECAAQAVPSLAQCLKDANICVRKAAISALGRMGSAAKSALPALIECLQNENDSVRCGAASSLAKLGPYATSGVPALLACLRDENVGVRTTAATALGSLGQYAGSSSAAEALCETLLDSHEGVRAATATALGRLGQVSTVPVLVEALKDTNEDVRKAAALALGQMREVAAPAVPQLTKALKDLNEDVRKAAINALGLFGSAAASATGGITACLSDTTVSVRKAAAVALGQIGHPSRGAIQALHERLKDPNEGVRKASLKAYEYLQRRRQEKESTEHAAVSYSNVDDDEDLLGSMLRLFQ